MSRTDHPPTSEASGELLRDMGEGLGAVCRLYGINPLYGRLYASIFLSPEPLSLPALTAQVGAAKSTVSVAMRKLEAFGLVRRTTRPGDRRDFYELVGDPSAIAALWLRKYLLPELQEGRRIADRLQQGLAEILPEPGEADPDRRAVLQARIATFDHVSRAATQLFASLLNDRGELDADAIAPFLEPFQAALAASPTPSTPAIR